MGLVVKCCSEIFSEVFPYIFNLEFLMMNLLDKFILFSNILVNLTKVSLLDLQIFQPVIMVSNQKNFRNMYFVIFVLIVGNLLRHIIKDFDFINRNLLE